MVKTIPSGPLQTNCYLYSSDSESLFIIDPADEAAAIEGEILACGLQPAAIILTHTHFDHILACGELIRRFGDLPVYAHEAEQKYMGERGKRYQQEHLRSLIPQLLSYARESLESLPEVTSPFIHGDTVPGSSLQVIHTPGHTPGSVCLYDETAGILFSGDTLFRDSVGRSDFAGGSHETLVRSIRERLLPLPAGTVVYPGHGDSTTIGYEKAHNPFIR